MNYDWKYEETLNCKRPDMCSQRRVRCDPRPAGPCLQCDKRNIACTFTRVPRKKGPPARRLTESQQRIEAEPQKSEGSAGQNRENRTLSVTSTSPITQDSLQPQFSPNSSTTPRLGQSSFSPWVNPDAAHATFAPSTSTSTVTPPLPFLGALAHGVNTQETSYASTKRQSVAQSIDWPNLAQTHAPTAQYGFDDFPNVIEEFFSRLDPTVSAFTKSWLLTRVLNQEFTHDPVLLGMLLAMKALVLIQPLNAETTASNLDSGNPTARALMKRAIDCRYEAEVGEHPSVEAALGAFYLFACEFGLHKFGSAWIYLQEALSLAQLMKVQDLQSYTTLTADETERRLRLYWLLVVTERAFGLQQHHSIAFGGGIYRLNSEVVATIVRNEPNDYLSRRLLLFDAIDERILDCWNGRCQLQDCRTLSPQCIVDIHTNLDLNGRQFGDRWSLVSEQSNIQACDLGITSTWLQTRLWEMSLHHGMVFEDAESEQLRPALAFEMAYIAVGICRETPLQCLEACGIGHVQKLHDIARTTIRAAQLFPAAVHAFRHAIRDLLQVFVAIFMLFRGGRHPYLGLLSQDIATLEPSAR